MMLHAKHQSSGPCRLKEEDFLKFSYRFSYEKLISPGAGQFRPGGRHLYKLGRKPFGDASYQISKLWAMWFLRRRFFKIFLLKTDKPQGGAI